jgi:hypothetical protein
MRGGSSNIVDLRSWICRATIWAASELINYCEKLPALKNGVAHEIKGKPLNYVNIFHDAISWMVMAACVT